MHIPFYWQHVEKVMITQYMQCIENLLKQNGFFFLLENYMGLFYCHCKEQRDLCTIHCTIHVHLFNTPYGIYAFGAVYGVQNICKVQNIGI